MTVLATLPTRVAAHAAFERYANLVREAERDPTPRTTVDHHIAIARAWTAWRDIFLAQDAA